MKRALFVLLGAVLLVTLLAAPVTPARAETATCVTSPATAEIGDVVVITCAGFTPNTLLYPYVVEPDGTAHQGDVNNIFPTYTNGAGAAQFLFPTWYASHAVSLGVWHVVVEEIKGGTRIHSVDNTFTVTGNPDLTVNNNATVFALPGSAVKGDWVEIIGFGFKPFEKVDVWLNTPNGDCSSIVAHLATQNVPINLGVSTVGLGWLFADPFGDVDFFFTITGLGCDGQWDLVLRGQSSKIGGVVPVTFTGPTFTETAVLEVFSQDIQAAYFGYPPNVFAMGDILLFTGSGYRPGEKVSCWATSPQGSTVPTGTGAIFADGAGQIGFAFLTGDPRMSEGAFGEWAMTCRGDWSKAVGVARYNIVGNEAAP